MTLFQTRLEVADAQGVYELHQRLWLAFPGFPRETTPKQPFLYRADVVPDDATLVTRILLRSRVVPELVRLGEGVTVLSPPTSFEPITVAGTVLRFLLRANPTRAAKATHPALKHLQGEAFRAQRGRRVSLVGEATRQEWMEKKARDHGFALLQVPTPGGEVVALNQKRPRRVQWTKPEREDQSPVRYEGIDFEGLLRVDDPEKFGQALADGIGPAKAFGFGLLSVTRVGA